MIERRVLLTSAAAMGIVTSVKPEPAAAKRKPAGVGRSGAPRFGAKTPAGGRDGLVIAGTPQAAEIASDVLRDGGNACDALLAAAIAQTVLEPHLTTITGCFSMLHFDAAAKTCRYVNGNVNAPLAFEGLTDADVTGGRAVAVPGYWAGFEAAHRAFGSKPLSRIMSPAISYAREGVACEAFLWAEIFNAQTALGASKAGRRIFMPHRAIPNPGERIYQHEAADLLERLQEEGSDYFYRGGFAQQFCKTVAQAGGVVTPEDFERYAVRWDEPVRGSYGDCEIVSAAAPDMGGVHLIEALNMVEQFDVRKTGPASESAQTLTNMMLALREVLVAGAAYGDPHYMDLPLERILSKDYAAERIARLRDFDPGEAVEPPPPGSCHLTVVDGDGNIATALHSTLSMPWVNGLFVDGVSICGAGNHFLRTKPQPGARVSVMICPNILFRDGAPLIASGSPSTSLVSNLVQNITNILDFGMSVEESVARPTFGGLSDEAGRLSVEIDIGEENIAAAERAGLRVERLNPWNFRHGAFEGIVFDGDMARACGDPRRTSEAQAV